MKNLQGDVVRIYKASDNSLAASYTYDSWGNVLSATGELATINPFHYRGYYYDNESWFYYLQSRYYDPAIGRFLTADVFASTGQDFIGYNLFAYRGIGSRVFKPDAHILHLSGKHHARGFAPGITETALRLTGSGFPAHPGSLQRHR